MSNPRSFKSKLRRVLFALLGVGGAAALLCLMLWPRERLLLAHAHKLPISFSADVFFMAEDQYTLGAWRSDSEQLLLRKVPGTDHEAVYVRNVGARAETPLQPFNDRFASQLKSSPVSALTRGAAGDGKLVSYKNPQQQFSSDGKWLLLQGKQTWRALALDGSWQREWPRDPQENRYRHGKISWSFQDGLWLEPRYDSQFRINGAFLHPVAPNAPQGERAFDGTGGHWSLGITHDYHLLTHDYVPGPALTYTLYDTALQANHAHTRKIEVRLPPGAAFLDVHLAPDGARLLWNLQIRQEVPGSPPIKAFLTWCGMKPKLQSSLYVSKADGSDMREVGHIPAALPSMPRRAGVNAPANINSVLITPQSITLMKQLYGVQWQPDSKHALFLDGNDVYEVTVE